MPADVERLLRIIAPALVLLTGCDAKEPKASVAGADGSGTADAAVDENKLDLATEMVADVGEEAAPKLDLPAVEPDPKPAVISTGKPKGPSMGSCPSPTWCTDKASAKEHAAPGTKYSMGCARNITGGAKGLDFSRSGSETKGFSRKQTKATRAEGKEDACCYDRDVRCFGGRPLLDEAGTPVVASFEARRERAWSSERQTMPASPEARAFAAQAWIDDAAMEHASVASFGRVALELLSLGAPPELIEGAHLAALDEIRHAKTCLSLARACGAGDMEPGRLVAVPQRSAEFARFAADTFIEGCVGESIAALVVTRAAAGAEDPGVRQALEEIAADEAGHAALAWKMVSWAIERGGAPVLAAIHKAADRLRPGAAQDSSPEREPEGIERLGRLSAGGLAQARRDGWTGIIEPMLRTLQAAPIVA